MNEDECLPIDHIDAVVAVHNIAGVGGVLNALGHEMERYIDHHYAARGIDHLPFVADSSVRLFVLTDDPAGLQAHTRYREDLAGIAVTPIANLSELAHYGVRSALHLPYIRIVDGPLPEGIAWRRYGLPPALTAHLKNKARLHAWLMENGFADYTPNHITCTSDEVPRLGSRMLHQISTMLDEAGMRGRYPLGLMIRSALSDGNYGMGVIVEGQQGQFVLKPDGKMDHMEVFASAEAALDRLREHIQGENDTSIDDHVIMSRLIDVEVSPGLCAAIAGGVVHTFPFNGQYMEAGQTACTGTWTFSSAVGISRADEINALYLAQTQNLLRGILGKAMVASSDLYAMLNIDVMIVGPLERELWARLGDCGAVGCYDEDYRPRAYDPGKVIFAEVNPRDTNWTIAMKAVLQAKNLPCTSQNLHMLATGDEVQVLALDHWHLPDGISIDAARERLLEFHRMLARRDEGFILRMSDNPAGVIVYTSSPYSERLREIMYEAYDFLQQGVLVPA